MANYYSALGFLLLAGPAAAQTPVVAGAALADTVRLSLRGTLPDSLAPLPTSMSTFRLQGQTQPVRPFLTIQDQLRTVAGVQVTPYSGEPGAMAAVRIRGAASLAGNPQPLYVVDGLPALQGPVAATDNASGYLPFGASAPRDLNPLLSLSTEDIDSIKVLKGALETARYGAQGQNGVIEITTRRGQYSKGLRIGYSGAGGVQQARYRYDLLSAREYAAFVNDAAAYRGMAPRFSSAQLATLGAGTDWQRELLRTAAVQEHHLSLQGGGATTRGYIGADFLDQTGIMVNSSLRRYGMQTNLEQRVGSRLLLTLGVGLSQTSARQPDAYSLFNALVAKPTVAPRDARGNFNLAGSGSFASFNPLQDALERYEAPRQRRLLGRLGLDYEFVKGLHLELKAGLEKSSLNLSGYSSSLGADFPGGLTLTRDDTYRKITLRPALRFARTLGSRHAITASIENWAQSYRTTFETRQDYGKYGSSVAGRTEEQHFTSYQAQASYQFAGRYEIQGSLHLAASSVLAADQRWQYLPAAQLTWHAGQEAFLRGSRLVSYLDARVGWGRTSNIGNMFDQSYFLLSGPGQSFQLRTGELTTQQDAGLSMGLAENRFTIAVEAYQRRTEVSQAAGIFESGQSYGQIHNQGLELTVAGAWAAGPVRASTSLAAALNQNEAQWTEIYLANRYGQRLTNGEPLSSFYGLRYQGVDASTGRPRYQAADGTSTGAPNSEDRQHLGSGLPRQLLSLTQEVKWRRLSAQAQLDGMFGYQMLNTNLLLLDSSDGYSNGSGRQRDRWQPTTRDTDVPAAGTNEVLPLSTYTLQSGNHVRLTALTLSLRVWEKEARSVTVWVGGNNLLVVSRYRGFDPNVSSGGLDNKAAGVDAGAYPVARTVSIGVRAQL